MKPVAIDLCCGLGGWTAGLLAEGWDVIGFDIERHAYGDKRYPADLILTSILELNGYDLRAVNPALVVASPPCQEYSYMAMPWKRGKQIAAALRGFCPFPEGYDGSRSLSELTALFDACFRIAREIGCPIVLENVQGAQPWVGRAKARYGSYYLWGDVGNVGGRVVRADRPAKFGEYVQAQSRVQKVPGFNFHQHESGGPGGSFQSAAVAASKVPGISFSGYGEPGYKAQGFNVTAAQRYREERDAPDAWAQRDGVKCTGQKQGTEYAMTRGPVGRESAGVKQHLSGPEWFDQGAASVSSSDNRKAASAMIAEIPFPLAQHIARVFKPR